MCCQHCTRFDHRQVDTQTQQDWYCSSSILRDDTVDANIGINHLCDVEVHTQAHNVDSLYQQLHIAHTPESCSKTYVPSGQEILA